MMETSAGSLYFVGCENVRSNGSLKRETRAPGDHIGDRGDLHQAATMFS
jgi:hypothetical protein